MALLLPQDSDSGLNPAWRVSSLLTIYLLLIGWTLCEALVLQQLLNQNDPYSLGPYTLVERQMFIKQSHHSCDTGYQRKEVMLWKMLWDENCTHSSS